MNEIIYLRPLVLEDAGISFHWRNIPEIWKYTRFRTSMQITLDNELQWLSDVIQRKDQKRFAICVQSTDEYIGNVHLIKITEFEAEFHLVVGNKDWWGKGIGKIATRLLLEHAFSKLNLQKITLEVHQNNFPAISIYKKQGFVTKENIFPFTLMELTQLNFKRSSPYETDHQTYTEE